MYPYPNSPEQLLRDAHERMRAAEREAQHARYAPSARRRLAHALQAVAAWLEPDLAAEPSAKHAY